MLPKDFNKELMGNNKWVGFDLDGTLAYYDTWLGVEVGSPIEETVNLAKEYLANGVQIKILTGRIAPAAIQMNSLTWWEVAIPIMLWCLKNLGQIVPITHEKDHQMWKLYDDRAIQVEKNTGRIIQDG